jgi:hypothetical protein
MNQAAIVGTVAGITMVLGGCCNCSNLTKTIQAREGFIESFNDGNSSGCEVSATGTDLKDATLSCPKRPIAEVEMEIKVTCTGFDIVGFESVEIVGSDGSLTCDVSDGCACSE